MRSPSGTELGVQFIEEDRKSTERMPVQSVGDQDPVHGGVRFGPAPAPRASRAGPSPVDSRGGHDAQRRRPSMAAGGGVMIRAFRGGMRTAKSVRNPASCTGAGQVSPS